MINHSYTVKHFIFAAFFRVLVFIDILAAHYFRGFPKLEKILRDSLAVPEPDYPFDQYLECHVSDKFLHALCHGLFIYYFIYTFF